ncbi:MAG TPA: dimethyl sulfoxide reductase anchor subunit [Clostridia bacterium]|nr:dimethyl sulfoxide reductase anchor subunit [Clostridia bacterium]
MSGEEWALIVFSLLTQMAVGTYFMLLVIRSFLAKEMDNKTVSLMIRPGFLIVIPMMAVALLASLFHLGSPFVAYQAVGNLGTSWLSREIFFSGLFFLLAVCSFFYYKKENVGNVPGWLTSLIGLAAVYSMAGIYSNTIKPAWTGPNTFVAFFGTSFLLGSLVAGALTIPGAKKDLPKSISMPLLQKLGVVAMVALALQLIYLPLYFTGLAGGGIAAQASANLLSQNYSFPLLLRWLIPVIVGGVLLFRLFHENGNDTLPLNEFYGALLLVLVAEVIGRYLF